MPWSGFAGTPIGIRPQRGPGSSTLRLRARRGSAKGVSQRSSCRPRARKFAHGGASLSRSTTAERATCHSEPAGEESRPIQVRVRNAAMRVLAARPSYLTARGRRCVVQALLHSGSAGPHSRGMGALGEILRLLAPTKMKLLCTFASLAAHRYRAACLPDSRLRPRPIVVEKRWGDAPLRPPRRALRPCTPLLWLGVGRQGHGNLRMTNSEPCGMLGFR